MDDHQFRQVTHEEPFQAAITVESGSFRANTNEAKAGRAAPQFLTIMSVGRGDLYPVHEKAFVRRGSRLKRAIQKMPPAIAQPRGGLQQVALAVRAGRIPAPV